MSKWVKCKKEMPSAFALVLVSDGSNIEIKWWDDESEGWDSWDEFNSQIENEDIKWWRRLPKLPS